MQEYKNINKTNNKFSNGLTIIMHTPTVIYVAKYTYTVCIPVFQNPFVVYTEL